MEFFDFSQIFHKLYEQLLILPTPTLYNIEWGREKEEGEGESIVVPKFMAKIVISLQDLKNNIFSKSPNLLSLIISKLIILKRIRESWSWLNFAWWK